MDNHFVINIGRELGSGGREIGQKLANELGISFYDKKLIELAATESGLCEECFEKADEKASQTLLGSIFSMRYPFITDGVTPLNFLNNDALFKIQSDVIRDLANKESCLFVGRCADYILRNHPRSVSVFISAPREERVARLCKRHNISKEEAEEMMIKADKGRSQYYNYYSYKTWGAAKTYDLCVDSSIFGIDGTVEFIKNFVNQVLAKNR
ncbi:MAG: AAA family ATPase [Bacteroides sp.]